MMSTFLMTGAFCSAFKLKKGCRAAYSSRNWRLCHQSQTRGAETRFDAANFWRQGHGDAKGLLDAPAFTIARRCALKFAAAPLANYSVRLHGPIPRYAQ